MLGIVPQGKFTPRHIRPADHAVHATSGYSLALTAGDFVFVAGRMADSFTFGEGIAAEARLPQGHLWKGLPIKLEAEFIIKRKIEPALKAAGSSLKNLVKCQVYMRDPADFAPFNEVWAKFFPRARPAVTLIPAATPGFFLEDARIEINTIALIDGALTRDSFADARLRDPAVAALMQKVKVSEDPALSARYPEGAPGRVTIRLQSGETQTVEIIYPRGHEKSPMDDAEIEQKFHTMCAGRLDAARRLLLITGPNMGGKSTYMRQVALIALLAHTGSFVPAKSVKIGPLDQIYTRIGASDDLAGGRSTFMVEMTESAAILNGATEHSLVLMDEVGRGTSTFDGLALAWAVNNARARGSYPRYWL